MLIQTPAFGGKTSAALGGMCPKPHQARAGARKSNAGAPIFEFMAMIPETAWKSRYNTSAMPSAVMDVAVDTGYEA